VIRARVSGVLTLGPYKIVFHFVAFVHESIILILPPSTCTVHTIAIELHDYCAQYDPPLDTPFVFHTYFVYYNYCSYAYDCYYYYYYYYYYDYDYDYDDDYYYYDDDYYY